MSTTEERRRRRRSTRSTPIVIGWREWVRLPDFTPVPIKAKVDTGARTSSLHAFDLRVKEVDGLPVALFHVHPVQRSREGSVRVEWPISSFRRVRSSNGKVENRPVVTTELRLAGAGWPIDITLTSRDQMGFRMLLGRAAVRRRFVVDAGRSFLLDPEESP